MTLDEIRKTVPKAHYPPRENCKFCNGTGWQYIKKLDHRSPCICVFVEHDFCDEAAQMLSEYAKGKLKEMEDRKGG